MRGVTIGSVDDYFGDVAEESVEGKPLYGKENDGKFNIGGYEFTKVQTWYETMPDENELVTSVSFEGKSAEDATTSTKVTIDNYLNVDFKTAFEKLGFVNVIESDPESM